MGTVHIAALKSKWLYLTTKFLLGTDVPSSTDIRIEQVRDASRQIVRELGFMKETVAATAFPPSAVHALIEIGANGGITAARLGENLLLEKSSVSRMLRKLVNAGEVAERPNPDDARAKLLVLTTQGESTLAAINAFGRNQVSGAFEHLSPEDRELVAAGLAAYARALRKARNAG